MRIVFALTMLLVTIGGPSALAQAPDDKTGHAVVSTDGARPVPPRNRRRATAAEVLKGQEVPASFDALTRFLVSGYEVVVWDAAGHKTRGWVSALSGDQIVIFRQGDSPLLRLFVPPQQRSFAADSVRRIDIVDSTANGVLLGALVGAGIMAALVQANKEDLRTSNLAPVAYTFLGVVSFAPSIYIGLLIDRMNNSPVYEPLFQPSRIGLSPFSARPPVGIMARVRF